MPLGNKAISNNLIFLTNGEFTLISTQQFIFLKRTIGQTQVMVVLTQWRMLDWLEKTRVQEVAMGIKWAITVHLESSFDSELAMESSRFGHRWHRIHMGWRVPFFWYHAEVRRVQCSSWPCARKTLPRVHRVWFALLHFQLEKFQLLNSSRWILLSHSHSASGLTSRQCWKSVNE